MLAAALLSPVSALGATLTLTFDDGAYDDTIVHNGVPGVHGPFAWIESNGIRADGFWARDVGTPDAYFELGHTHIQQNWSGRVDGRANHNHAWTNDLQGLLISMEDGSRFDIVSIDFRLAATVFDHPDFEKLDWIWADDDPQMLISTSFDPTNPDPSSEFTAFGIDTSHLPFPRWWHTLQVTGFENITSFYLSDTLAFLDVDTIKLRVHDPVSVPEVGTLSLMALGTLGLVRAGRRPRRHARSSATR